MTEVEIVEWLQRHAPAYRGNGVVVGIGDDCAVFRQRGSTNDLCFTTDQMVEGVHFHRGDPARRVGEKAVARALSDIAAMGADPVFCLLSLALPRRFDVQRFYRGVWHIARRYRLAVAGGDLARSRSFTCDVVVCGSVPRGQALLRTGARPGDSIYVSGPLGASASREYRVTPEPRLRLGKHLRGRATACIDLSDGLSLDLHRLAKASKVAAELDVVPAAPGATTSQALHGGEDYELLYTGRDLPGIRVGLLTDGPAGRVTLDGRDLQARGFDHFRPENNGFRHV